MKDLIFYVVCAIWIAVGAVTVGVSFWRSAQAPEPAHEFCVCECKAPPQRTCPPTTLTAEGGGATVVWCGGACSGDVEHGFTCDQMEGVWAP